MQRTKNETGASRDLESCRPCFAWVYMNVVYSVFDYKYAKFLKSLKHPSEVIILIPTLAKIANFGPKIVKTAFSILTDFEYHESDKL